jgi:hypothetical protein
VVETRTGSQGHGASLGVTGDSDGWGPDDRTSDAPPVAFQKVGVFLMPPVDRRVLLEEEIAVRRTANGLGESFFGLARYLPRRKS